MLPTINTVPAALHDPLMENTYTRVVYSISIIAGGCAFVSILKLKLIKIVTVKHVQRFNP